MKYAIIIPDGCADDPQESLGGRTPLQAAHVPNMDAIVKTGVCGRSDNVPKPLTPASDVATLSLFGYDPLKVYTGRAPLETIALGIQLGPRDWAIRCNTVTISPQGTMQDFTAGHISSPEGARLMATLQENLAGPVPGGRIEFYPGVQYRNILVFRADPQAPFDKSTRTQAPHDIPDQPITGYLPAGPGSELLNELMQKSIPLFHKHPVNQERIAHGKNPATQIWLWGLGLAPAVDSFESLYGKKGAIISAVDLVRGTGLLIGWNRIDAPGATGYLDTDYASKGRTGVAALKDHDLVCVHIEAPDEASHEGRTDEKIKALERIDEHIVGPLHAALKTYGEYRILVTPDHRTRLQTRAHSYGEVPIAVCGTGISATGQASYDEVSAAAGPVAFEQGWQMMRWFLG